MGTKSARPANDSAQPAQAPLDIRIRFLPNLPQIRVSGALVADDVRLVRDALHAVLVPVGQARLVLLDLRRLVSCDGLAAAGLARLLAVLTMEGSEVRLQGPPHLVEEIEQRAANWLAREPSE